MGMLMTPYTSFTKLAGRFERITFGLVVDGAAYQGVTAPATFTAEALPTVIALQR
jgi:hypothetical protein